MLALLAQNTVINSVETLYETTIALFGRIDMLASWDHIKESLTGLSAVWSVLLLVVGLLTLVNGYRWRKIFVVAMSVILGSFAGYLTGKHFESPMLLAICFGALAGVLSWPLMKFAIAAVGGLMGAFLGANIWAAINQAAGLNMPQESIWIGALIGLIVMGLLAFLLAKLSLVVSTSVSGATMAAIGGLMLLAGVGNFGQTIESTFTGTGSAVLPMVVLVAAIIGLVIQEVDWSNVKSDPAASAASES